MPDHSVYDDEPNELAVVTAQVNRLAAKIDDACDELIRLQAVNSELQSVQVQLVAAVKTWQNYSFTFEQRLNATLAAIARAEGASC